MTRWNPNDYRDNSSQQQKWAAENLACLNLNGHERILDLGCGDGKITTQVAHLVPHGSVLGLDSSAEMVAFAQKNSAPDKHPNLRFQQGHAQSLDFHDEFDWVISFSCLHWVIDHRPVLAGIRRALRPGGRTLLQFGGQGNAAQIARAATQVMAQPPWTGCFVDFKSPWGFYSPQEYRPWLEEAGLKIQRLELVPKDMTHQGPNGLKGWLRTTWMPYWQRVPTPSQEQFLDQIVNTYVTAHPPDAQGLVHLPMVRLEVEATRPRSDS